MYAGWSEFTLNPRFGAPDRRLHLALLPMPFAGALETASVVVLMLNPGLNPVDYFAEYEVPEFRKALLSNLQRSEPCPEHPNPLPQSPVRLAFRLRVLARREFSGNSLPIMRSHTAGRSLNRSGSSRARSPSSNSTRTTRNRSGFRGRSPRDLSQHVLHVPTLARFLSRALARVRRCCWSLARAKNGALRRSATLSSIPVGEARGAHLTPRSRGGAAILRHLPAQ